MAAAAVTPGVSQAIPQPGVVPAVTPGTTGRNDAADPAHASVEPTAPAGPLGAAAAVPGDATRPATAAGSVQHATMCYATQALPQGLKLDQDGFVAAYMAESHETVFFSLKNHPERVANLKRFLDSMAADGTVDTVFKAAYILATAMHEGRCSKDGWAMTWAPVSESPGNGADYWDPVIVRDIQKWPLDADGDRLEPDKDAHGNSKLGKHAIASITDANLPKYFPAAKLVKRVFNGRGYVQLTWCENYVAMGETTGIGKKLASQPELALDHDNAYKIASMGMALGCFRGNRTYTEGQGRTGGHKLGDYTDYVKARAIINGGGDAAADIARYARIFERLIQDNRLA